MSNEQVYADGLLNRALDPATQPPEIRDFLQAEIDVLNDIVVEGMSMIDVGCGTGRHLALLRNRLRTGVGVDYEHAYVVDARRREGASRLHFVTGDATCLPVRAQFDLAVCMTNTWGTMNDQRGVLNEMRRCVPQPRMRLLSVFAEASVAARREWYRRLGHTVAQESAEYLMTEGGFRSEHFTKARLQSLVGDCTIRPCADIAYIVTF
ncbi:MAG TPA: class I SAM-dependent methyltransferase [Bryobacteraceae bacterium]|nr:class I SAM-dependent methyltransferase [Bryobacteraceae bacterium]